MPAMRSRIECIWAGVASYKHHEAWLLLRPGRGLTVVTVQPDGTLIDSEACLEAVWSTWTHADIRTMAKATFDTMKAGSDALAVHINNIADGTMVLIGALDEVGIYAQMDRGSSERHVA